MSIPIISEEEQARSVARMERTEQLITWGIGLVILAMILMGSASSNNAANDSTSAGGETYCDANAC